MPSPAPPHILVAERDDAIRSLLARILVEEGYRVTVASTVEQTCALLCEQAFDLVLAGNFTLGQGPTLSRTGPIRQAAGTTPIVLFTRSVVARKEAVAAGFRDLVTEGFDLDIFLDQLQKILANPVP